MKSLQLFVLASILSLFPSLIQAQAPPWQWAHEVADYSSGADVQGWSVTTDDDGNVFATGAFVGDSITIGGSVYVSPGGGMYVIKYDVAGTILWSRVDGGSGMIGPRGITTDADGSLYIATTFDGDSAVFGGIVLTNAGSPDQDMCIIKYDNNGNILWAISAGTPTEEWVEGITTDQNGNLFITGAFNGPALTLGSTTLVNSFATLSDVFLAKMDPNGIFTWAVKVGGLDDEWPTSLTSDAFGNVVISGIYYSDSAFFDGTNSLVCPYGLYNDKLFIAKYDSSGNFSWAQQAIFSVIDYSTFLYDVATDPFGNVWAIGSGQGDTIFVDTLQLIGTPTSDRDLLVVKYSPGGLLQWARREIGTGDVYGFNIEVNSAGEAYTSGYFDCDSIVFGTDTTLIIDQSLWSDMYLAKYQPSGTVEWATNIGGTYYNTVSWGVHQMGLTCDNDGNVAVSGSFIYDSTAIGSNYLMLNNSWPNAYVAVLNDSDPCDATFTLVADTSVLHHYWILNQATGSAPLSYVWDWGDGTHDYTAYPTHTYVTSGFYTICLTITDVTGCTDTHCETNYLDRSSENASILELSVVATLPTGINSIEAKNLVLYPNPASDFLTLGNCHGADRILITDVFGKTLLQEQIDGSVNAQKINLAGISNGVYFVKAYFGKDEITRKFVVLRNQ